MRAAFHLGWLCAVLITVLAAGAEDVTVTARVALMNGAASGHAPQSAGAVLWLVPQDAQAGSSDATRPRPQLVQRNKTFQPHLLVVPVGSVVAFPNRDPFFHNVFSLFEGKRFDLGLYEAGSSRDVLFDKPGISYIFCDIHAEMSAVIIALPTPYFAISDRKGQIIVPHVPPGRYMLHVWYETASSQQLSGLTREVEVSENDATLGLFRLTLAPEPQTHKDKYGRDYDPPSPDSPAYARP
jgi:plastocyanin